MQAASSTAEKATPEVSPSYSAKEVAEALEQLDALLSHLNAYGTYYRGALLRLMPLDDNLMNKISQFSNLVERRVLGEFNGKIALPLRAELDPRTQDLFNALVAENARLTGLTDGFEIALPTPGLHIEPRLGQCNACEDYVQSLRTLDISTKTADLDLKRQQLEQEKLETDRYAQRLKAHELSDPENKPGLLQVAVEGGLVTRSDGAGVPKPPAP